MVQDASVICIERMAQYEDGCGIQFEKWIWVRVLGDTRDKYKKNWRRHATGPGIWQDTDYFASSGGRGNPDQRGSRGNQGHYFDPVDPASLKEPEGSDLAADIKAALEYLSERQLTAVTRVFLEGATQEQVAEELGVSQPAVSKLLDRAFEIMREHLCQV